MDRRKACISRKNASTDCAKRKSRAISDCAKRKSRAARGYGLCCWLFATSFLFLAVYITEDGVNTVYGNQDGSSGVIFAANITSNAQPGFVVQHAGVSDVCLSLPVVSSVVGGPVVREHHDGFLQDERSCIPTFSLGSQIDNTCFGSLDGDSDKNVGKGDGSCKKKVKKVGVFKELDPEVLEKVENAMLENNSEGKEEWARGRFDAWRLQLGFGNDIPIEEIPKFEFAELLEKFILVATRIDGQPYPPDSLKGIFRCMNRIIKRCQEVRMMKEKKEEPIFDLFQDVAFIKARKALEFAMKRAAAAGAGSKRNKPDILSLMDQHTILAHPEHQLNIRHGLQKRFAFYCMSRFLVRGGKELSNLRDFMFKEGKDLVGEYLEYCETNSKNWKTTINKCKVEDFREPVRCYETDVVVTWRTLIFHLPECTVNDEIGGRYVFLQAITQCPRTDVWYNTNHVSQKTISSWLKQMVKICGIEGNFSNKSLRATAITQMQINETPLEVGMSITGHRSAEGYKRYDQSGIVQKAAAMEVLSCGRLYSNAFKENVKNLQVCLTGQFVGESPVSNMNVSSSKTSGLSDVSNLNTSNSATDVSEIEVNDEFIKEVDELISQYSGKKQTENSVDASGNCTSVVSSSGNKCCLPSSGKLVFSGNQIQQVIMLNVNDAGEALKVLSKMR